MADALSLASIDPDDADRVIRAARAAGEAWRDAEAIPLLTRAIERHPHDPRLLQFLGLAHRALDDAAEAAAAFARAAELAPVDPLIAHSHARCALEAGLPAVELFARARALASLDAGVLLGHAAARVAERQPEQAIAGLERDLAMHPGWSDGHARFAGLVWSYGDRNAYARTFEAALAQRPTDGLLWRERAVVELRAGLHADMQATTARARRALGPSRTLDLLDAASLSEQGRHGAAEAIFTRLAGGSEPDLLLHTARHLLRTQRPAQAARLLEARQGPAFGADLWPLLALAWRRTDDPRSAWLEGDPRLVSVHDIGDAVGSIDELASCLRDIHSAVYQPLDQSLRNGTQTDGPLFSRADPEIRRLRAAILAAVECHVASLPSADPRHPTLSPRRDRVRFAGSWSVRLTGSGRHVSHVHPQGWISSAFYVTLPDAGQGGDARSGWLELGEADDLGPPAALLASVEPKPGRLVLFPSTMWHGTRPFQDGERMTVAFDIARSPG